MAKPSYLFLVNWVSAGCRLFLGMISSARPGSRASALSISTKSAYSLGTCIQHHHVGPSLQRSYKARCLHLMRHSFSLLTKIIHFPLYRCSAVVKIWPMSTVILHSLIVLVVLICQCFQRRKSIIHHANHEPSRRCNAVLLHRSRRCCHHCRCLAACGTIEEQGVLCCR